MAGDDKTETGIPALFLFNKEGSIFKSHLTVEPHLYKVFLTNHEKAIGEL